MKMTPSVCFLMLVLGIWLCATAAAGFIKKSDPIDYAFVLTIIAGIGCFLLICMTH